MNNSPNSIEASLRDVGLPTSAIAQMNEASMKAATRSEMQAAKPAKTKKPRRANGKSTPSRQTTAQMISARPPQVTLSLDDDRLDLVYSVQYGRETYKQVLPVADGRFIQSIGGLIEPLVKMTNALLHGEDLRKLNQLYSRDDQGRPTKDPLRVDGQVQFRPNSLDATRSYWQALTSSTAVCTALAQLGEAIDALKQDENIKLNVQSVSKDDRSDGAHISL